MTVGGLDPGRCYDFRVRAVPQDFYYGLEAQPSDWTSVTHWRGAAPAGARSDGWAGGGGAAVGEACRKQPGD